MGPASKDCLYENMWSMKVILIKYSNESLHFKIYFIIFIILIRDALPCFDKSRKDKSALSRLNYTLS